MNPLRSLVEELLTLEGAAVEPVEPDGLEVLAPEALQRALRVPEWFRLGFGPELPEDARRVTLESEWMAHLGDVLGEGGRWLTRTLRPAKAPLGDPGRALAHGLSLLNATYRLSEARPAWTRYLVVTFRFSALSDEKREGILHFGLNTANGATLDDLVEPLLAAAQGAGAAPAPEEGALPEPWDPRRLAAAVDRAVPPRVRLRLEPFLAGMARRQERDLARLFAYYGDLRREALERLGRLPGGELNEKQQAAAERERQRLEAVAREYRAKVGDLAQKYAVKVTLEWVQTQEILSPVERLEVLVRRRKGERRITLDWNPVVKKLEQAPCEHSFTWERTRLVCDDALHLVSPAAHAPCARCGKPYCRACRPRACPKCGQGEGETGTRRAGES